MFIKIVVALDSSYFKTYIAFIRLLVTGGGHLEFPHEKVDGKNREFVFVPFGSI